MTIDELLAAAGLTANDEIPIWDAEATGEPTKKITAQNLAAAVVALANLVTGVKGDAESSYRQGNVNLTPANIGAMPAEPITIELKPPVGSGFGGYIDFHFDGSSANYTTRLIEDASGQLTLLGSLILSSALGVPSGGTGATDADGARANLHAMRDPDTTSPQYGTGNFDDAPVGFSAWYGPNCVNAPFQAWTSVLTMNFIVGYVQQIAFSWLGGQIAYRVCDNGTWYAWKYITLS